MTTSQQLGGAAGAALFVTVMTLWSADPAGGPDQAGVRSAFVAAAVISTAVLAGSLLLGRGGPESTGSPAAVRE